MRKVLLQMGLSVDGIVAGGPQGTGEADAPHEDEAVRRWKVQSLHQVGTHIMGRVTYEQMAAHWPYNGPAEYADLMNSIPKVVFSKTLTKAQWKETRIARGDLSEEIARLRGEPGKAIMAHGGASFVQALSRQGLIDEYRLVIRPVALGRDASVQRPSRAYASQARRLESLHGRHGHLRVRIGQESLTRRH